MSDLIRALDFSYGSSKVTPAWCAARLAEGFTLAVADLWAAQDRFPDAAQALRYWREAGGQTGGYFCVSNSRPAAEHFAIAKETAGAEWPLLCLVAVDVELAVAVTTVREAYRLVEAENLLPMVYTSAGEWQALTGDSHACADLWLWDASQGIAPSLAMSIAYGGWSQRAGHQYQGTTLLDGIEVDLSVFDGALLAVPERRTRAARAADIQWGHMLELRSAAVALRVMATTLEQAAKELEDTTVAFKEMTGLQ